MIMDMQSRAFADAGPDEWGSGLDLAPVPDEVPILPPSAFDGWDRGRLDPKTVEEARRALAARVLDPTAPDTDLYAYDGWAPPNAQPSPRGAPRRPLEAGSIRIPWLADAARSAGLPVVIVPGSSTRGHGGFRAVELVMGHHTATPDRAAGDYPSLRVVRDGRAGLAGPLCNLGLGRSGTVYVVATGVGWHAGASRYLGFTDLNDESIGIEAESAGTGKWTPAQLDAYPRLVAALLRYLKRGADRYVSHRSAAIPSGRKPDPAGISDQWMRDRVHALLVGHVPPITGGTTHTVVRGDTLYSIARRYGTTVGDLRSWNSLTSDTLTVGQTLKVASSPAPPPPPAPSPVGGRMLQLTSPPMVGEDVAVVQRVLRAWYSLPMSFVDREFGPQTKSYVQRAQRGTPPSPVLDDDGKVGPATRRKLGI